MKKITITLILSCFFLALPYLMFSQDTGESKLKFIAKSFGVPADPHEIRYIQPNGTTITFFQKGDGAVNWCESKEGYAIIKNASGYFEYADNNSNGDLIPSGVLVSSDNEKKTSVEKAYLTNRNKGIPFSSEKIEQLRSDYQPDSKSGSAKAFPTSGTRNLLVILIQFPDAAATFPQSNFNNMMNQAGYNGTGSFQEYYLETSYGDLTVNSTVVGWYTAANPHDYYGKENDPDGARKQALAAEAVDAAEAGGVNFSIFDNDGNGYVDGVMVIHQGDGAEQGDLSNIWSHSWGLYGANARNYDGVNIQAYTMNPETSWGAMGKIGVLCHEFGHNLGLPDWYDTDYAESGGESEDLGNWDCMAGGSYNNGGSSPAHHNAYAKYLLNWIALPALTTAASITMPNVENNQVAYKYATTTTNEFFVIENRQQIGFDAYLPGHGLLIYHVDENYIEGAGNCINCDPTHQGMDMEEADGTIAHGAGDAFPAGATSFTDGTTPSAQSWAPANTSKPITNISETSQVIYFDFMGGSSAPTIVNVVHSPDPVYESSTVGVSADITDNGTINTAKCLWCTDGVTYGNVINMTLTGGNTYQTSTLIPAQTIGTTVYYKIEATDNTDETTTTPAYSYSVEAPSYCASTYTSAGSEYILNVTFNTINNASGDESASGYGDYTAQSTDVNLNSTHLLSVTINTLGAYTDHCWAYFDWDKSYTFDAEEAYDLGDITNVTAGVLSQNITIPEGATLGSTRMRINMEYNGDPGACDVDHAQEWGETEDYSLNIVAGVSTYSVTFNVSDGTSPIEGASVTFNGLTQPTNLSGQTIFTNVNVGTLLPYSISAANYNSTGGTLDVVDQNVTQNVTMIGIIATNITVEGTTPTSATISWDGEGATNYIIYFQKVGATTWTYNTSTSSPYVINNLEPNTNYNCRLKTYNGGIYSSYTSTVNFTTQDGAPVVATNVAVEGITATTATISWDGEGATNYIIYYQKVGATSWAYFSSTSSPYLMNNLEPNTNYNCRLRTLNAGVYTPYTSTVTFTTLDGAPVIASNVLVDATTATTATISWDGEGATNYIIYYKKESATSWSYKTSTTSPYTLTGLLPATNYNCRLRTYNGGVYSAYSSTVNFTTSSSKESIISENINVLDISCNVYPNPVVSNLKVAFNADVESEFSISIVDISGRKLRSIATMGNNGHNEIEFDVADLKTGIYFVNIECSYAKEVIRFIKCE
ncbi:MAG: hypothetical protein A2W91_07270 [Bacteroidetes bacterium GWF2_38_335]|nr:MAG: hypothetical protein A2W91_07270 [Bacteroidetes bacterium GWF2_38_335]OFY77128.1 MAG: hypothetical protein A2281_14505 [Bacteroidetes bacterium RIFOXYA12_FULL_38_20]HBS85019.1 hypothetical protein [Bacteroidales bacterium]